jgi:uncharacterized repeat protein (TIGR01451 family)
MFAYFAAFRYQSRNRLLRASLLFGVLLFTSLPSIKAQTNPSLEFTSGDGNPTGSGPTTSTTIRFRNNTNNPSGNSFVTYSPALEATITLTNQQYTTHPQNTNGNAGDPNNPSTVIGWFFGSNTDDFIFPLMNYFSDAVNGDFTSTVQDAAGTGISIGSNRALLMANGVTELNGQTFDDKYWMNDLEVTFNRPVNNPVVHLAALGAQFVSGFTRGITVELELLTSGPTLSKLSGTSTLDVVGNEILNTAAVPRAAGGGVAHGSVLVSGEDITNLTFRVYVRGESGITGTNWGGAGVEDGWFFGMSLLESDLLVTKSVDEPEPLVGDNVNFTITATNNGPSNNTNVLVEDLLPSGFSYVSHTTTEGAYDENIGEWNIGDLDNDDSETLVITATVLAAGEYENTAEVSGDLGDPNINNNDDSAEVTPRIRIELTDASCWRTLTSPVAGETYQEFFERFQTNDTDYGGLWTQGATGARFTGGDPNVFTMNSNGSDWIAIGDLSQTIPAGTGFLISVFDQDDFTNPSSTGFPKVAEIDGTDIENTSSVSVTLGSVSGTTASAGDDDPNFQGFSMLGNPYKSPIDFDLLSRSDIEQIAWVYDRSIGSWISWNGTSGDITNGIIAPGQGFLVQNVESPTGTPNITFPEISKTTGGSFVGKNQIEPDFIRFEIEGEQLYNSAWLEFSEYGSEEKTKGDAIKLIPFESEYLQLSSQKDGQLMDIGRFPLFDQDLKIPISVQSTRMGSYTIRVTNMSISGAKKLYLYDQETGIRELIREGMQYTFTLNQAAKVPDNTCFSSPNEIVGKAKELSGARFIVTIGKEENDSSTLPSEFNLKQNYPNPFNPITQITYEIPQKSDVLLEVFDLTGKKVSTLVDQNRSAGTYEVMFDATKLSSGIYVYRLQAGTTVLTRKLTLIK